MSTVINRPLSQKVKNISLITLLAFLLSFFLHSQHISKTQTEQNTIDGYQDCHICQQGMDSAPKAPRLTVIIKESFALLKQLSVVSIDIKPAYIIPQLRAPPFFQ